MKTYYITTNPEFYGSDANEDDAIRCAEIIARRCSKKFHDVVFILTADHTCLPPWSPEIDWMGDVQQYINDNWDGWV